jgi:FAD:protein FMN transferase
VGDRAPRPRCAPRAAYARIMGMPISVAGAGSDAAEAVFGWLRRVDELFSTYRCESEISRLDRGELALADADPLVREVLARCERLREETGGYFDARAGGRLDPSGLVKGWAVDRAAALLDASGEQRFCISAGGDLVARGGPWRVGVRHPRRRRRLAAALSMHDAAVATSGAYERGAHVVDPHTRRPARGALSVTVVGPDLGTADAYATAAFAMGAAGPAWTAGLDGYEAMTVIGERVLSTPGFARLCGGSVAASVG